MKVPGGLPQSPSVVRPPPPSNPSSAAAAATTSLFNMDENSRNALFYCSLLALQFGLQPMIANKFTGQGVSKTSVVIATEIFKIFVALFSVLTSSGELEKIRSSWSISDSLRVAALPAALYAVQNVCVQYGYVLLDSMTFNLLNQTKVRHHPSHLLSLHPHPPPPLYHTQTLSAAVWLYLLMDQKQSPMQMLALLLLLLSAVLLNINPTSTSSTSSTGSSSGGLGNYQLGVIVVSSASLISGLSAALTQRALVGNKKSSAFRSPIFLSAELAVYGIGVLVLNLLFNQELQSTTQSFLANWSIYTFIPVITNVSSIIHNLKYTANP